MRTIISFILFIVSLTLSAQESFDKYFTDKVLRFDFMLAGNSGKTSVYPVGMKEEPFWAGSKTNMKFLMLQGTLLSTPELSVHFSRSGRQPLKQKPLKEASTKLQRCPTQKTKSDSS